MSSRPATAGRLRVMTTFLATLTPRYREQTALDRSFEQVCLESRRAWAQLPHLQSSDSSTASVTDLRVSAHTRACGGVSAVPSVSSQRHHFADGIFRNCSQAIFSAIFQDQFNRFGQAPLGFFFCAPYSPALTIASPLSSVLNEHLFAELCILQ